MMKDLEDYAKDKRPACKYAAKCYQKNPEHSRKYKHPPKSPKQREVEKNRSPPRKMLKLDPVETPKSPVEKADDSAKHSSPLKQSDDRGKHSSPVKQSDDRAKHSSPVKQSDDTTASPSVSTSPGSPHSKPLIPECKIGDDSCTVHEIPNDVHKFIEEFFLVKMPDDFISFWEFCKTLPAKDGLQNVLKSVNLVMVGPFDVLLGNLPVRANTVDYLLHWRYFYDPPEFQTILASPGKNGFHMGYFRDSPKELPCFIASNEVVKGCKITPMAENIFGAVLLYLEATKKRSPFTSIACQKLITPLKEWANNNNFTLEPNTSLMKKRSQSVVAKTFHGAGIVVPYNKSTELGYRRLAESDAKIKEMISAIIEAQDENQRKLALTALQPVITYANIATDECDFGTGFELGIDFFTTGENTFKSSVIQLLTVAYEMLNRNEFSEIIKAHMNNRRKGTNLSCAALI